MNNKFTVKDMVFSAVFAAVIAVLSQAAIPLPAMPITLQTLAVALCGYVLGVRRAAISVVVYIALGAVGVPVFTGFKGGFQCLIGPTGGFIFGFIALAAMCGIPCGKSFIRAAYGIIGLIICHIFGFVQFSVVMGTGVYEAFLTASLPFILKDSICVISACYAAYPIRSALARIGAA